MTLLRVLFAASLLVVASERTARADMIPTGIFVPVGGEIGYGMNPGVPNGLLLGGEASVVYFDNLLWGGAYADVIHDFGAKQTRISFGPEIGVLMFTFDGGYLTTTDGGSGWVLRGCVDLIVPHLCVRYGQLRGQELGELGLLLKIPFPVSEWEKSRREPPAPPQQLPSMPPEPMPTGPLAPDEPTQPTPGER